MEASSKASSTPDDAILAKDTLQSTSSSIFEDSYRSIHQIIRENVSKLPFLDGGENHSSSNDNDDEKVESTNTTTNSNQKRKQLSGEEKMNRFIVNVYDKFMDSAQLYVEHELLTIDERQFSRKKRERLLRAFHQELEKKTKSGHVKTNANKSQTVSKSTDKPMEEPKIESTTSRSFDLPSSIQEMPSIDQIKNLDDEITNLRQKSIKSYYKMPTFNLNYNPSTKQKIYPIMFNKLYNHHLDPIIVNQQEVEVKYYKMH